jgi:hypothetical protein
MIDKTLVRMIDETLAGGAAFVGLSPSVPNPKPHFAAEFFCELRIRKDTRNL